MKMLQSGTSGRSVPDHAGNGYAGVPGAARLPENVIRTAIYSIWVLC